VSSERARRVWLVDHPALIRLARMEYMFGIGMSPRCPNKSNQHARSLVVDYESILGTIHARQTSYFAFPIHVQLRPPEPSAFSAPGLRSPAVPFTLSLFSQLFLSNFPPLRTDPVSFPPNSSIFLLRPQPRFISFSPSQLCLPPRQFRPHRLAPPARRTHIPSLLAVLPNVLHPPRALSAPRPSI
jgi:hypothetical protein